MREVGPGEVEEGEGGGGEDVGVEGEACGVGAVGGWVGGGRGRDG